MWLSPGINLIGLGPFLSIDPGAGKARFARGQAAVRAAFQGRIDDEVDLPGTGPVCFGSWTFDDTSAQSLLWIPSVVFGLADTVAWKTEINHPSTTGHPGRGAPAAMVAGPGGTKQQWRSDFDLVHGQILEGKAEKVVLARKVEVAGTAKSPGKIIARLARRYPGCFTFALDGLIGATPELLIRRLGAVVDSMPVAGSAPRGRDDEEDEAIGRRLQASEKDRREHELTVRSVVEGLAPYCSELEAEHDPSLLLLANLQHLSTKVQGRLKSAPSAMELAGALHPTAAVCGTPRREAMEIIRSVERFDRRRYAGPVGWMDRHGDGEWAIALRCAELSPAGAAVYAGAGIMAGSQADSEFQETELKLQAMLSALSA